MDVREGILSRRSTRKYRNVPVEPEKLARVLEAGRHAPSGGNSQTTHFIVLQDARILEELAELASREFARMEETPDMYRSLRNAVRASKKGGYVFHYHAPVLVVTANRAGYGNNMADCACALENMMLMANALDLGSCWINQLRWLNENPVLLEKMRSLGLEEGERVYGAVALGYADTEDGLPERRPLPRTGNPVTAVRRIWLAGGCFWGVQRYIDQFDGVLHTEVGYANGRTAHPSYEEVCRKDTGHAETVQIDYDEGKLPTKKLLEYYFRVIDPLSVNRQGGDSGTQYRTGIYYTDAALRPEINAVTEREAEKAGAPLAVEVKPLENFYRAEEYHQKYLDKNPGGYCHIPWEMMQAGRHEEEADRAGELAAQK